jgi:hypothetical protein
MVNYSFLDGSNTHGALIYNDGYSMSTFQRERKNTLSCGSQLLLLAFLLITHCSSAVSDEYETVLKGFGVLNTVAGNGAQDGGNDWQPSMEGGPAVNADLSRPHIAMADKHGTIYIADKESHAIRKVSTNGTIHTVAGTSVPGFTDGVATNAQLNNPNGLYTFSDGTTYILDLNNSAIRKFSTNGMLSTVYIDPDGIILGRGIWVTPDESTIYYASGTRVMKLSPPGGATPYATGFTGLGQIAIDPRDGNLVVADRLAHLVFKVFTNGTFTAIAGNGTTTGGGDGQSALSTGLEEVRAIAFEPNGAYFLGTHDGSQVWYVDTAGIIHLVLDGAKPSSTHGGDGEPVTSPGLKVSEVRALSIAPNGDLLVTENDNGYIRVVDHVIRLCGFDGQPSTGATLTWTSTPRSTNHVYISHDLRTTNRIRIASVEGNPTNLLTSYTHPATNEVEETFFSIRQVIW